jgi:hypothetical protein
MAILVSDSSVLIDLERGGLLEPAFACGLVMVVPDLLYENELKESNCPYLKSLGLAVTNLTSDEVMLAQEVLNLRPALSPEDCFALACATRPDHTLLAGDGPLRTVATERKIPCRGLLWLLDQMWETQKLGEQVLHEGLTKIFQHPRCRLPRTEVERRLKAWRP